MALVCLSPAVSSWEAKVRGDDENNFTLWQLEKPLQLCSVCAPMEESYQISEGLTTWCIGPEKLSSWGMRETKAVLQICFPPLSLAAGLLLVCLEENRIWLLHGLQKGQVFTADEGGGWSEVWVRASQQGWEPQGWEPSWQDAPGCISLPSSRLSLVHRAPDHSRGFFHAEQSPSYFFFFFFFPLELAVGKELETICTRKHRLKNECVSPSPLGKAA